MEPQNLWHAPRDDESALIKYSIRRDVWRHKDSRFLHSRTARRYILVWRKREWQCIQRHKPLWNVGCDVSIYYVQANWKRYRIFTATSLSLSVFISPCH